MTDDDNDYGFVCECGGEVEEVWEKIGMRGGAGRYRCTSCDSTGEWRCDLDDEDRSGLSGCLVRREDHEPEDEEDEEVPARYRNPPKYWCVDSVPEEGSQDI